MNNQVQGWQRLSDKVNAQWFQYVQETQLPKIIGGVSPIRSLVNVGSGVIDLVLLPMEQYNKDRNLIKGRFALVNILFLLYITNFLFEFSQVFNEVASHLFKQRHWRH